MKKNISALYCNLPGIVNLLLLPNAARLHSASRDVLTKPAGTYTPADFRRELGSLLVEVQDL